MRRLMVICAVLLACGYAWASGIVDEYRFDYSGTQDPHREHAPTMWIDFTQATSSTITTNDGNYVLTKNGDPDRVNDWTQPNGLGNANGFAWDMDGTGDWLSRTSDGTFNPSGSFSVQCFVTPHTVSGAQYVASKWLAAGNQKGWVLYLSNDTVSFLISSDGGGTQSIVSKSSGAAAHRPLFITATYECDGACAGSAVMNLYVDNHSTVTTSSATGPIHASTGDFILGACDGGCEFDGLFHFCRYIDGKLISRGTHDKDLAQQQGRMSTYGNVMVASSTAPPHMMLSDPASGVEPFLVTIPVTTGIVTEVADGAGGIASTSTTTSLCQRGVFENMCGASPCGWTEVNGGTSDATEHTASMAEGGSSIQMVCDGSNLLSLDSACVALSASTAYYADAWLKTTAGTPTAYVVFREFTDGSCSVGETATTLWSGDPGSTWAKKGGTRTTGGSVQSGRLQIKMDTTSATMLLDAAQFYAGSDPHYHYCGADTDASVYCGPLRISRTPVLHMSDGGEYEISFIARTPYTHTAGSVQLIFDVQGTSGSNNNQYLYYYSSVLYYDTRDSAGTTRYYSRAQPTADTDMTIKCGNTTNGDGFLMVNTGFDRSPTGAGTGIRDGVGSYFRLGSSSSLGYDTTFRRLVFRRRITEAP